MKTGTKKWSPMRSSGRTERSMAQPQKEARGAKGSVARFPAAVRDWGKPLAVLLALAALAWYVSAFWFQLALIQGESMEPAYRSGQLVVLDKHRKDFRAGDVIAFRCQEADGILIKRIAALPGDTLWILEGTLYRNGEPDTDFFQAGSIEDAGMAAEPVTLSEEEFFVLGDNLKDSRDSRFREIGAVNREDIVGKVIRWR